MSTAIRPAATVILWRGHWPDPDVFLVERAKEQKFFGGYHAFPGGTLDADEVAKGGWREAAARELAEEVAVTIAPQALVPSVRLTTPEFSPRRYDTQFFLAEAPVGARPRAVLGESAGGRWWKASEALAAFRRDLVPIPPPTLAILEALTRAASPDAFATEARRANDTPHHLRFHVEFVPGLYVLPLRTPTLPPATTQNCYFFAGPRDLVIVDPGTTVSEEQTKLVEYTRRLLVGGRGPRAILLTHHHGDHVGAVESLKREFGFPVWASVDTAAALPLGLVDHMLAEGDAVDLGTDPASGKHWKIRVLATPGHTSGHLAFLDERFGALLAGDLVSGVSTILIDPDEGDMAAYMATLARLAAMPIRIVLPGHGPAISGASVLRDTLAHRKMREEKVLAALAAAPLDESALLAKAYDDVAPEAHFVAARSLESILVKLAREGRVVRASGNVRLGGR
ncbi:MAG: MBL fold metallo-hydrolase [Thermoplasmatota archaeon]